MADPLSISRIERYQRCIEANQSSINELNQICAILKTANSPCEDGNSFYGIAESVILDQLATAFATTLSVQDVTVDLTTYAKEEICSMFSRIPADQTYRTKQLIERMLSSIVSVVSNGFKKANSEETADQTGHFLAEWCKSGPVVSQFEKLIEELTNQNEVLKAAIASIDECGPAINKEATVKPEQKNDADNALAIMPVTIDYRMSFNYLNNITGTITSGIDKLVLSVSDRLPIVEIAKRKLLKGYRTEYLRASIKPTNIGAIKRGNNLPLAVKLIIEPFMQKDDQYGHILAVHLGGNGDDNYFPQNGNLNQGEWKARENRICRFLVCETDEKKKEFESQNRHVDFQVRLLYHNENEGRPYAIVYFWRFYAKNELKSFDYGTINNEPFSSFCTDIET